MTLDELAEEYAKDFYDNQKGHCNCESDADLCFKAGHASRDAEVAEKDAEIIQLKARLWAADGRVKGMVEGLEFCRIGEKNRGRIHLVDSITLANLLKRIDDKVNEVLRDHQGVEGLEILKGEK